MNDVNEDFWKFMTACSDSEETEVTREAVANTLSHSPWNINSQVTCKWCRHKSLNSLLKNCFILVILILGLLTYGFEKCIEAKYMPQKIYTTQQ